MFVGNPYSRSRFIALTADLSALIRINLTKWRWIFRRGEGGGEWMGGPGWSPVGGGRIMFHQEGSQGTRTRATIKALPAAPHHPRPYGSLDQRLGLMPMTAD
ncbi:MAG: hypothetical protein AUG45_02910 [Ktedonobacter sp. 13_1_20CM_3_54_15]|nr:MAG: hypothetical protein AUG45_02910 [Ktedonobacter sp. 13_1_20CM_3_54_15]